MQSGQLGYEGVGNSLAIKFETRMLNNVPNENSVKVLKDGNLSAKLLRINPITGAGLADNPFFNGNANANQSKVYQYGFRNPFRFSIDPRSGKIYVGDVGWTNWEEINAGAAGANFG
jgi:glucose/arabinose dehydrogenase